MAPAGPAELTALNFPFKSPDFIFFTDFDGTITLNDSNDYMTDNVGMGRETRLGLNRDILDKKITFRDAFKQMMDSSQKLPFPEAIDYLVANVELDPGFKEYFEWSLENKIPTVVVSSGIESVIRAILAKLIGDKSDMLDVISNDVMPRGDKSLEEAYGWELKFHDDSDFGHDKSLTIRPYAQLPAGRPTLFYAGDGVSDLSAARETDLLFAKKGHDLIKYCVKEDVPFTVFEDWSTILTKVKQIVGGKKTVQDAAAEGVAEFKAGAAGVVF